MDDYLEYVTFLPVTRKGRENSPVSIPKPKNNDFFKTKLEKGNYDINYVITLLKIIQNQNEKMKFNPRDFQFTLAQSLQKLICMLEVERDLKNLVS